MPSKPMFYTEHSQQTIKNVIEKFQYLCLPADNKNYTFILIKNDDIIHNQQQRTINPGEAKM